MVKKMSGAKRVLACACSVAMIGAFAPTAAFADVTIQKIKVNAEGTAAVEGAQPEAVKTYTDAQLKSMVKKGTYNYLYSGKSGATKVTTSELVPFTTLLKGVDAWNTTSKLFLEWGSAKNPNASYAEVTQTQSYFPNYVAGETSIDTAGAVQVVPGLALSATKTSIAAGEKASEASAVPTAEASLPISVFGGTTEGLPMGMRFWTGVKTLTVGYQQLNNPMTAKLAKTTVKKGKTTTVKTSKAQGKVTYKSSSKKVTVSKKGKVSVNKKAKAGKYTITVKAAGNADYLAKSAKLTLKVK